MPQSVASHDSKNPLISDAVPGSVEPVDPLIAQSAALDVGGVTLYGPKHQASGYEISSADVHPAFTGDRSLYGMEGLDSVQEYKPAVRK